MSRAPVGSSRRATRRGTRLAVALSVLVALVLAAGLVWHSAYATFTDVAPAGTFPVGTATVALSDDDAGTAFFAASDLRPGITATRCIVVTSTSTAPTVVKVYASSRTSSTLSTALRITVDGGTGGCTAFLSAGSPITATLSAFPTTYAAGVSSWTTTGTIGETRTYQVTYSLPATATTRAQGGSASLGFTWEAQTP